MTEKFQAPEGNNEEAARAGFEAFCLKRWAGDRDAFTRNPDGTYWLGNVEFAWCAYRAALVAQPLPVQGAVPEQLQMVLDDMRTCYGECGADYQFKELSAETVEALTPLLAAHPKAQPASPERKPLTDAEQIRLHEWAVSRWREEVEHRPLVNIHRRSLDDAWRQVIRFAGGNPDEAVGPCHDALVAATQEPRT